MRFTSQHLDLILFKTYANLKAEASRTYLSFLWWIVDPILSMAVYYLVFDLLLKRGTEDFVPFLLIGLTTWQWFSYTIQHGMPSIIQNNMLMNQVDLPKFIFPSIIILMDFFKFSIVFTLVLLFLWIYGFEISITYLALPYLLILQFFLITTCTFISAAIVPFLPDLRFLIEALLHLLFFLSGIFFSPSSIDAKFRFYFYLNPIANLIDSYRKILMYSSWPDWHALFVISVFACLGVYCSYNLLKHFDHTYPKLTE